MSPTLPQAFILRMQEMLKDDFTAFIDSFEKPDFHALRINTLKADASILHSICPPQQADALFRAVPWCEGGFYYDASLHPGKHPFHEAGAYYIQEPSAMMPAVCLGAQPGETILDLCAAPGGKSTQIACGMRQQGLLICNEIHPARAKILSENIERMGIANAIVTNESPQSLAGFFPAYFDRIMVDAPCSGEGMFRKNEEACLEWSEENVTLCAHRQDDILLKADKMLKPGGRIVYSTCTFAPLENEGTVARFLSAHPDYHLAIPPSYDGVSCGYTDTDAAPAADIAGHVMRLWPHRLDGEGHFTAILQKGNACTDETRPSQTHPDCRRTAGKRADKNAVKPEFFTALKSFIDNYVNLSLDSALTAFGEQLYLLPEHAPSLSGLKVLRPGLHLGTVQKGRFEPSHALALFLKPQDARYVCRLHSSDPQQFACACRFIEGQTFPFEGEKGWYLICLDGISLGWGRLAGGIMKNHYPKGLRKTIYPSG